MADVIALTMTANGHVPWTAGVKADELPVARTGGRRFLFKAVCVREVF
jgi:hypothetical protein